MDEKYKQSITFTGLRPCVGYSPIVPKPIARVKICGAIVLTVTDFTKGFIKPTPEQIKNLKELFCIDVELLEGDADNDS